MIDKILDKLLTIQINKQKHTANIVLTSINIY